MSCLSWTAKEARCWDGLGAVRRSSMKLSLRRRYTVVVHAEPETEAPKEEKAEKDPIWVRREKMRELQKAEDTGFELPFWVSLPLSSVMAIAAVGSVFEFLNRRPLFGIIQADDPLWLPIVALFVLTGLPLSGYLFFSAVAAANKQAERMDSVDKA